MNENSFLHIQVETPFKLNGKILADSSSNTNFRIVTIKIVLLQIHPLSPQRQTSNKKVYIQIQLWVLKFVAMACKKTSVEQR